VRSARILVVDDDPWIQRIAASRLGQQGHQVSLAGDGPGAFALASKVHPDLVVSAVSLPTMHGWSWWERLRALPACAQTPIVFLLPSGADGDVPGATPGDLRLRKPFRVEDLERAVVTAIGDKLQREGTDILYLPPASEAPPPPPDGATPVSYTSTSSSAWPIPVSPSQSPSPSSSSSALVEEGAASARPQRSVDPTKPSAGHRPLSAFRGEIDQIGLSSILVLLEMERKTGILLCERESSTARLFLRKGRVIRADSDAPSLSGAAAVYEALAWRSGSFDFLIGDIGGVDDIQASTTFLLLEGARRIDEANEDRRAGTIESKI
jgi:CheY-like chemotaxis protein